MADLVNTPQLKFPMQMTASGRVMLVEQDSFEDRVQNAIICLRYERGQRTAIPEFGLPDQAMRQGGADLSEIVSAVLQWEPDIDPAVIERILSSTGTTQTITIEMVSPAVFGEDTNG